MHSFLSPRCAGPRARRIGTLVLFLLAASLRVAGAQAPQAGAAGGVWVGYAGDHALGERLALTVDGSLRMSGGLDAVRQYLLRPGLSATITPALRASVGYGYLSTEAFDDLGAFRLPEHRAWEMVQLSHGMLGAAATHRLRLEQRYVRQGRDGAAWAESERARYQMRVMIPLPGAVRGRASYVALSDELFASFGGVAGALDVDQNRAVVALGMRATSRTRVEVGYMNQALAHAGAGLAVRTHVLQLAISSTTPLRR